MQILPTQKKTLGILPFDFLGSGAFGSTGSDLFADLLKTSAPVSPTASMQDNFASGRPVADREAVSSRPSEPASASMRPDDSMRDVKMSREDYTAVREKLEKAGVSKEKLEELDQKAQSPEGLTWGQMMHAVRENVVERHLKPVKLSDSDKAAVSSMLTKVGFTPDEAGKLIQTMQSGKPAKAFEAIAAKLAAMEPGQTVSLSKDEMGALAKALKLSDSASQKLLAGFGGKDSLELNAEGLKLAFAAVKDELSQAAALIRGGMKEVRDALGPLKENAAKRMGIERDALDARVQADHVKPSNMLKEPSDAVAAKDGKPQSGQHHGHQPGDPALSRDPKGRDQQGASKNGGQDPKDQTGKAWGEFASKVRVEGNAQNTADARFASLQDMAAKLSGQTQGRGAEGQAARVQNSQILSQVESGILRNLGQGVKQLTLELTPDTLGRLNVMLTVKGKEVQAVIKAESPQAERMIAENLQQIKQSLENQGLTVSKMEVRAGLSQDSNLGQQWAGAEKHNLSQERREAMDRMRTNALLAGGSDPQDLARGMQNSGVQVKNSQGGLSLIA